MNSTDFCVQGRLAPRFYLLGSPKSGTTYFFEDFARSSDLVHYEPGPTEPPWHAKEPWVFANIFQQDASGPKFQSDWLSHYPQCAAAQHKVAVDCTPGYFGSQYAPGNIHAAYAPPKTAKLVFMVFLRNPIARSHSHYYQYKDNGVMSGAFPGCAPDQFPPSFEVAAVRAISQHGAVCHCDCDKMFSDSFYVESFERYFSRFSKDQFHVVPFELATGEAIVHYTWRVLGISAGGGERSSIVGATNAKNHHNYPSLVQELMPEVMLKLRAYMNAVAGPGAIAKLLAGSNAHLFQYSGPDAVEGIAHWLGANWGGEGV